jgi:hypothetical protein
MIAEVQRSIGSEREHFKSELQRMEKMVQSMAHEHQTELHQFEQKMVSCKLLDDFANGY